MLDDLGMLNSEVIDDFDIEMEQNSNEGNNEDEENEVDENKDEEEDHNDFHYMEFESESDQKDDNDSDKTPESFYSEGMFESGSNHSLKDSGHETFKLHTKSFNPSNAGQSESNSNASLTGSLV